MRFSFFLCCAVLNTFTLLTVLAPLTVLLTVDSIAFAGEGRFVFIMFLYELLEGNVFLYQMKIFITDGIRFFSGVYLLILSYITLRHITKHYIISYLCSYSLIYVNLLNLFITGEPSCTTNQNQKIHQDQQWCLKFLTLTTTLTDFPSLSLPTNNSPSLPLSLPPLTLAHIF